MIEFFLYLKIKILDLFNKNTEQTALKIIKYNNKKIRKNKYSIPYNKIMIMLPHCVQGFDCKVRVTLNPDNCVRCKKCIISDLLDYSDKNNVMVFIATGGTLARKIIKENKPQAIVAVACYRDLLSGIIDVKKIPVIGILNIIGKRGPCVDTSANVEAIIDAVEFFHGKD